MLRSSPVLRRLARCSQRSAALHIGRATPDDTREFLKRSAAPAASSASLRVGKGGETLAIGARGVGSPALWAKDVPRIDASKAAMSSFSSNFLQTAINPFEPVRAGHKQSYVEALVLQELVEELNIPREAFVVSALLGDNLLSPAEQDPSERLEGAAIKRGVEIAIDELTVEVIDHVVCKVPDEILTSSKLLETLTRASDALEALRSNGQVQSYGFAFPGFLNGWASIDGIVENTLIPLSEKFDGFASLQLPVHIGNLPLPRMLSQFRDEKSMLVIGDRPLESVLSNGKPLMFKTYAEKPGEDVALLLKTAFNLAISVETTYIEKVAPSHPTLKLPAPQDVAWGHILANQHGQFDNLEEWIFVLESQIYPRFEVIVKELAQHEETKQFGFAYSMALRELFKCFTASIELADSSRVDSITDAWVASGLVEQGTLSVEEVAVKAALSAGANVVLVQEQLPGDSSLSFSEWFTAEQVQTLSSAAAPFLQAE